MRRTAIVGGVLACLLVTAVSGFAAVAPAGEDMKGALGIGIMGGLGVPTGQLGQEVSESSLSSTTEGLPAGQGTSGHVGLFVDYFVTTNFAVGPDFGYLAMKGKDIELGSGLPKAPGLFDTKTLQFGAHVKYFLPTGGRVLPYLSVGFGMYSRKADLTDFGVLVFQESIDSVLGPGYIVTSSVSDTKAGMNGGVGVQFKSSERFGLELNGMYHTTFGKLEAAPVVGFPKETFFKDWNYITFNAAMTFYLPMGGR